MSIYYLPEAEMPLTPKGYCDESFQEESLGLPFIFKNQNNLKKLNNSKIYTTI